MDIPPFGVLLSLLFEKRLRPDGKRFSIYQVAEAAGVSPQYIGQLRTGAREDPRLSVVQGIASFFEVPAGFFSDVASYEQHLALLTEPQHGPEFPAPRGQEPVLLRQSAPITERARAILSLLNDHVQELEQHERA